MTVAVTVVVRLLGGLLDHRGLGSARYTICPNVLY